MKLALSRKNAIIGILLVLPSVLVIASTAIYPLIRGIWFSFLGISGFAYRGPFVGLSNYAAVLGHNLFLQSFRNNVVWASGTVAGQILIGLIGALLLNKNFRGKSIARAIMLLPYMVPVIVVVIVWRWMLHSQYGIINIALKNWFGLEESIHWFSTPTLAMVTLILVGIWKFFPFAVICFLAALQTIPPEYYDAAKVDGASRWKEFWYITLPQLREVLLVVVLIRGIFMYTNFSLPWLLTSGGPGRSTYTLPILTYVEAFRMMRLGRSAAVAVMLCISLVVIVFIYLMAFERGRASNE